MRLNCKTQFLFLAALFSYSCLQLVFAAPITTQKEDGHEALMDESAHGTVTTEEVPQYLLNVYECWSNRGSGCLPETDPEVNIVRSVLGKFDEVPPKAIWKRNQNQLVSLSFAFNSTSSGMISHDDLHKAFLRVYKTAISEEQIDKLKSDCDLSNLKLQVYSTVSVNNNNEDVVVLERSIPLTVSDLMESKWLSFQNMRHAYRTMLQESFFLRLHLVLGGSCDGISPSQFGFRSDLLNYQPELIGFVKNGEEDEKMLSNLKNMHYNRRKREVTDEQGSGLDNFNNDTQNFPRTTFAPRVPSTIDEMKKARCHFYEFNVSFVDIGWGSYIVRPLSYQANFCAGTCLYPLQHESVVSNTKHSFVQSIVNHMRPDLVPPPCCAPSPDSLLPLTVVTREGENNFAVHKWADMIATSCGCL